MSAENLESVPKKSTNQTLVDYTEQLTDWYIEKIPIEIRKKKGQYFTNKEVSKLMVALFNNIDQKKEIKILDPGAGIGIFESSFCEYLKSLKKQVKVSFDLYENDTNVLSLLELNMKACGEEMASESIEIDYKIFNEDFILSNASIFNNQKNFDSNRKGYDFIISNPPYYKLNKDSPQIVEMENIVNGQPNIYPFFMAISARLLKNNGQMTVLTPRSYCSGLYFKKFRECFFNDIRPQKIHLFESRKEIFKKFGVLQENVILNAIKTSKNPKNILISTSNGIPNEDETIHAKKSNYDKIVIQKNNDIVMRIPISVIDELIAEHIDNFDNNLKKLGFKVSTGPVVPFRAKKFLLKNMHNYNIIPLIWMHNIVDGIIKWPLEMNSVPIGLIRTKESEKILKPNKNYILIKRFSTKEGKQRINAGIYLKNYINSKFIGIENHINYIDKKDGELSKEEAYGLAALLNSKLYNRYFQITNGSTQVNASEIRDLPIPSLKIIKDIGISTGNLMQTDTVAKEKIILKFLKIDEIISSELLAFNN